MSKKEKKMKKNVRFPIGFKLVLIFSIMVIFALGATTFMIAKLFSDDERINANDTNFTINQRTSKTVEDTFYNIQNNTNGFFNFLLLIKNDPSYEEQVDVLFDDLCSRNKEIKFIYTTDIGIKLSKDFRLVQPDAAEIFSNFLEKNPVIVQEVMNGQIHIKSLVDYFKSQNMVCIMYSHFNPLTNKNDFVSVGFDITKLNETCTDSANISFVMNNDYELLINDTLVEDLAEFKSLNIVKTIKGTEEGKIEKNKNTYKDANNKKWIYSYSKIIGDIFVVTQISEEVVFEAIKHTTILIIFVSIIVFFLTIIIIRGFSKSLTSPISDLVEATNKIDAGEYDIALNPKTHDEIAFLSDQFTIMASGLSERKRLMDSFSKFTNKVIAEKAVKGELALGGENKNATVFFSDIRSFTAMSENMTPNAVVEFLNDYFSRMVECVNKTNGIVDKFIGDAVMAVWGAATTNGSAQADAWAAIKAALMMRIALYHFNENQIKNGREPIKIGCGINSGPIVAGQIGSEDHINYTVIGDTVNLASRTEALNKPFATDILITENTYELIKDKVIVEEMPGVTVKGKSEPIKMYAVINAVGVKGPQDIHKLREFLGWDEPELEKVNTDEEEKKYKISQ